MKLLKRVGPALVTTLGPRAVRMLGFTWRIRRVGVPYAETSRRPSLYCFWHGDLLIPLYAYQGIGLVVLVSAHRDGQIARSIVAKFGFSAVTGSTSRGGAAALRTLLSCAAEGKSLCVPPDGPRGPARNAKKGVVYLASRARIPVVPAGVAASSAWRLRSWDRMTIPKPFSTVAIALGTPMEFPPDADGDDLDRLARELERAIDAAREEASRAIGEPGQTKSEGGRAASQGVAGNAGSPARP